MKLTITAGANTYKIAAQTLYVVDDGQYHGRLLNEPKLKRRFAKLGTTPVTVDVQVRNNDAFIIATVDLWAASVLIESDTGFQWRGEVTAYDSDGAGILYLVVTEKSAPELSIQIPDEVARLVSVNEDFHVSAINAMLPTVIGGNVANPILLKGILIDKTQGIYLFCPGEIHQVVTVYRGTEALSAGFTSYTGTSGQANYAGIVYVQITDESLRKNDDGTYSEISADVVGVKLGTHTIEECRNGGRFLYWLLKTAREGTCGWGLGIAEADIDSTAFTTAISRIDAAGLKLDGVLYFRQTAQSWIDQICQAIRGSYSIGADGKRRLFVNASASSEQTYTRKNVELMRHGKGAFTGRVYNKGQLEFAYNPITAQFLQKAQYNDEGSQADISDQEFSGQSYLIRDMDTAQAIVEYTCKKSLIGAQKVQFATQVLPATLKEGSVITMDYPEKSLSGTYQVTDLQIGDSSHVIEAEKYDTSIFAVGASGTGITWIQDPPVVSPYLPGAASGLALDSEVRPSSDGTNIVVITGSFTLPDNSYLAASIEFGESTSPSTWNSLGLVRGTSFEIAPVKPDQLYSVRIQRISTTGKSDYITGTITTQGDTVPPGAPSISAASYLKHIGLTITLGSVPSDMAGFMIYRNTTNNSSTASQIGSVTSKDGKAGYSDKANAYGDTFYYWAKAFDSWGNPSGFSAAAGPIEITAIEGSDIVNGALNSSALFAAGVIDATAIATAAVTEAQIALGAVSNSKIATDAVTAIKIAASAVEEAKIAASAVSGAKIATGAVSELKLASDAVTEAKIALGAVSNTKLATDAVTAIKIATGAVEEAKIAAGAVTATGLSSAALKSPYGAIASYSALNCTTTSIAEDDGVRDVSGNANHGKAYGGVSIENSDIGPAFSFDGSDDYINLGMPLSSAESYSISLWVSPTQRGGIFSISSGTSWSDIRLSFHQYLTDSLMVSHSNGSSSTMSSIHSATSLSYTSTTHVVVTFDGSCVRIYFNGNLDNAINTSIVPAISGIDAILGRVQGLPPNQFAGLIAHPRIFNRALTATEVKSLYMFPGDVAFGRITADLLTTGELITLSAQIKDAVITNAKVANLDAAKINTGSLAAARIAAGSLTADKITGTALVVTGAAADVNAGTTTISGGKITAGSIVAGKLATDSVVAANIAAGSVIAAKIAAGAITAEKLLIGKAGAALNDDPGCEDISAWSYWQGSAAYIASVTDGKVGNSVIRSPVSLTSLMQSIAKPVDPTKVYRARAWARKSTSGTVGPFILGVRIFNSSSVSVPTANSYSFASVDTVLTTSWQEVSFLFGPGTAKGAIDSTGRTISIVFGASSGDGGYSEAQDIRLEEVLPATLIQDGAIITAKLAADSVVASKIAAGAIETAALSAGAITTDKLNVSAMAAPRGALVKYSAKGMGSTAPSATGAVVDSTGNGNHASAFNGISIINLLAIGPAFDFNGSDDYILGDANAEISGDCTMACWVQPDSVSGNHGFIAIQDSSGVGLGVMFIDAALYLYVRTAYTCNYSVSSGTLHHVAVTLPSNQLSASVYVNGVLVKEISFSWAAGITTTDKVIVGKFRISANPWPFDGKVGTPTFWRRELSAAEIKTLYMMDMDDGPGVINADRIVTGELKSQNWGETTGSYFDLDSGDLKLGGSTAPKFSFTTSTGVCALAGFTIDADDLTAGSRTTAIGISTDTNKRAFWAGGTTSTTAPFQVKHNGEMVSTSGEIGGFEIGATGLGGDTYTTSSVSHRIEMSAEPIDTPVNMFDLGGPAIRVMSYTFGPYLKASVTIGAGYYFDGSTTAKAHIGIAAESTSDHAIYTNGKITGYITDLSDAEIKSNFEPVSVLDKLKTLDIQSWQYDDKKISRKRYERLVEECLKEKNRFPIRRDVREVEYEEEAWNAPRHIGPTARDFNQLFGIAGGNTESIGLGDKAGVALRAIQELASIVDAQAIKIQKLQTILDQSSGCEQPLCPLSPLRREGSCGRANAAHSAGKESPP